jgi:hypothetical protein
MASSYGVLPSFSLELYCLLTESTPLSYDDECVENCSVSHCDFRSTRVSNSKQVDINTKFVDNLYQYVHGRPVKVCFMGK